MFSFSKYKRAITLLAITFVLDLLIRVYFYSQIKVVVAAESFLFLIISLIMFLAAKRDKAHSLQAQRFDFWFTLFFFLGGIRSALWTVNVNIYLANIIILFLGIIIGVFLIRWWKKVGKTI
jgi:hypothetical protein